MLTHWNVIVFVRNLNFCLYNFLESRNGIFESLKLVNKIVTVRIAEEKTSLCGECICFFQFPRRNTNSPSRIYLFCQHSLVFLLKKSLSPRLIPTNVTIFLLVYKISRMKLCQIIYTVKRRSTVASFCEGTGTTWIW